MRLVFCIAFFLVTSISVSQNQVKSRYFVQDSSAYRGLRYVPGLFVPDAQNAKDTLTRWIIKFKDVAAASNGRSGETVESQHQQFVDGFKKLFQSGAARANQTPPAINFHYKRTFNGVAVTALVSDMQKLKALSVVDIISTDRQVKISDSETNALIGAPQAWAQYNITGKGVTIGIIDTGIDYRHPDLGGGIGAGKKVIGGFDFVNNDSDPFDDNGHGTHVAGIAAANGPNLKGVAPDAQLYALKALGADGSGFDSWILAAIEKSVDPDGNPATNDALDVVNMSLGRFPDANEPISQAVNEAVARGVVFVTAAGNSGMAQTIDTPGIAEKAITVAASDNNDAITFFSSRGPTRTFGLKPDICAPGLDVNATLPGGLFGRKSGTSMAAPHVAGAAALILEKNPTWGPAIVKSALMQHTKSIGLNYIERGTGRLDVVEALNATSTFEPASIGVNPIRADSLTRKIFQVKIYNHATVERTYNLSVGGDLQIPGLLGNISPTSLTVAPGNFGILTLTVDADSRLLAKREFPASYMGYLIATTSGDRIELPVGLMNPNTVRFDFGSEWPEFVIALRKDQYFFFSQIISPISSQQDVTLLPGTYHFFAPYSGFRVVLKEDLVVSSNTKVVWRKSQADKQISFQPKDEKGKPIPLARYLSRGVTGLRYQDGVGGFFSLIPTALDTIYTSSASTKAVLDVHYLDRPSGKKVFYSLGSTLKGINGNQTLQTNPASLVPLTFKGSEKNSAGWQLVNYLAFGGPNFAYTFWNGEPFQIDTTLVIYTEPKSRDSNILFQNHELKTSGSPVGFQSPSFVLYDKDSLVFKTQPFGEFLSRSMTSQGLPRQIPVGTGLHTSTSQVFNHGPDFYIGFNVWQGVFNGVLGDMAFANLPFRVKREGNVIARGFVKNQSQNDGLSSFLQPILLTSTPGLFSVELDFDVYQVAGRFGKSNVVFEFDTRRADPIPPTVRQLQLWSGSSVVDQLSASAGAWIRVVSLDYCGSGCYGVEQPTVIARYRLKDSPVWTSLTTTNPERIDLPVGLPNGFYDLEVRLVDKLGNSFKQVLSPAFLVGANAEPLAFEIPRLIDPANNATDVPINPRVKFTPVAQASSYTIDVSNTRFFDTLRLSFATTESNTRIPPFLEKETTFFWRVRANYAAGPGPWSSSFTFKTGSMLDVPVSLVSPADQAIDQNFTMRFVWRKIPNATQYEIQGNEDQNFGSTKARFSGIVTDTTFSPYLDRPMNRYYWRVRAIFPGVITSWSEVRQFKTKDAELQIRKPTPNALDVRPNIVFEWANEPAAQAHEITVSENQDFSNPVLVGLRSGSFEWNTYSFNKKYYLKITSEFVNGYKKVATSTFSTTTLKFEKPKAGDLFATHQTVEIEWSPVPDAEFAYQLSEDERFSTGPIIKTSSFRHSHRLLKPAANHYVRVGLVKSGETLWASASHFRTNSFSFALRAPENKSTFRPDEVVQFSWQDLGAQKYLWQVSEQADFSDLFQKSISSTQIQLKDWKPSTDYFWRVGTEIGGVLFWSGSSMFSTTIVTAAEQQTQQQWIFPNPATDVVHFSDELKQAEIKVYDLLGRLMFSNDGGFFSWSTTNVPNGIYLVVIKIDQLTVKQQVVVNH